ncbi:thioredoxin family protein [Patescibacteria group bacterium]|nr:thioredoxin family protein [Patescibacteria group bacterium]
MVLLHSEQLPGNWPAPDFKLNDTEENVYSLDSFTAKKGLLIIFTCNHCPYAQAAWPLLIDLFQEFNQDIGVTAINPNDAETYPEDSLAEMKQTKMKLAIPFPYLHDETQQTAKSYQAQCTPDIYLFINENSQFKLFYHGRINDNWQNPEAAQEENLKDAIKLLVNGQPAPPEQPPSIGCSIKWKGQ